MPAAAASQPHVARAAVKFTKEEAVLFFLVGAIGMLVAFPALLFLYNIAFPYSPPARHRWLTFTHPTCSAGTTPSNTGTAQDGTTATTVKDGTVKDAQTDAQVCVADGTAGGGATVGGGAGSEGHKKEVEEEDPFVTQLKILVKETVDNAFKQFQSGKEPAREDQEGLLLSEQVALLAFY